MKRRSRYFGIMVSESRTHPPFRDQLFYRRLCKLATRAGMRSFVFSPGRIDWVNRKVIGYTLDPANEKWKIGRFPLPHVIYDRCFYRSNKSTRIYRENIRKLKKTQGITFLGYGLRGKWDVYQMLSKYEDLTDYLPPTDLFQGKVMLNQWLKQYGSVFLKPQAGSQGKRAMHITALEDRYIVIGRNQNNESFRLFFYKRLLLCRWIQRFIHHKKYIIQPYLELMDPHERPFDIRVLTQKDGKGNWQITGMAARIGQPGQATSNLHGGGTATEVEPFLTSLHGEEKALSLLEQIMTLSSRLPLILEEESGRLVELGIDYGVDRSGKLWLLEVNSKPGRTIFLKLKNRKARITSLRNPIRYASFIMDRQLGG